MVRNASGKVVNQNGEQVFKSEVFDRISSVDNLIQICPNSASVDVLSGPSYTKFPEEFRKFIEFHSSKLLDDNFSLARETNEQSIYINNVLCLLAITNKLATSESEKLKNDILGGKFPTKNDDSADSMVPLFLCTEMLKSKFMYQPEDTKKNFLDVPVASIENHDIYKNANRNSTLGQEFDKVIAALKKIDYDKDYFQDMSDTSQNYLGICQRDPSGSVDIYAKCYEDRCDLCVEQMGNVNTVKMFDVMKKKNDMPAVEIQNPQVESNKALTIELPAIEKPVTTNQNLTETENKVEEKSNDVNLKNIEEQVYKLRDEFNNITQQRNDLAREKKALEDKDKKFEEEQTKIQNKINSLYDSVFKKTPFEQQIEKEQQIQQMVANGQQPEPVISPNAAMFK